MAAVSPVMVSPTAPVATRAPATTGAAPAASAAAPVASPAVVAMAPMDGRIVSPVPGVPDAYTKPPPPFKSVAKVPGRGSKVTALLSAVQPPVPPRGSNRYWQELEKQLGVSWEPIFAPGGTFDEKFAAISSSGDLPDLVQIGPTADQLRVIGQGAFADLTPYLGGDALKQFPNLALIDAKVWKNMAIRGKIYGVPKTRYVSGNMLAFRGDWLDKLGNPAPKNSAEFRDLMVTITKTDFDGRGSKPFALASGFEPGARFNLPFFRHMFRVPNEWRVESNGALTNWLETDELRQALSYMRELYTAGIFHPDSATLNSAQLKEGFAAGKFAGHGDTITGLPDLVRNTTKFVPTAKAVGFIPPGFDGGKATVYNNPGFFNYIGISAKAGRDPERAKELLRLLDYWCAPFGSDEWNFTRNGLKDVHYTLDANGNAVKTDLGKSEIGDLSYTATGPIAFYNPDIPGLAEQEQKLAADLLAIGTDNPVYTLFSSTNAMRGAELGQLQIDRTIALVTGREPLSALDTWIKDWRSRGGDAIRKEYQDALKA